MSKPGADPSSGISLGDALRLPKRHPAWRRREAQSGSRKKLTCSSRKRAPGRVFDVIETKRAQYPSVRSLLDDPAYRERTLAAAGSAKARAAVANNKENLKTLHDAGVRMAFGSDSGVGLRFPGVAESCTEPTLSAKERCG